MKPHSVIYKSTSKKSSEIVDSAPVNGVKLIQLFQCLEDEALLWAIQIGEPLKKKYQLVSIKVKGAQINTSHRLGVSVPNDIMNSQALER